MSVFHAYDIRGVYPTELDEDFVYRVGRAFVQYTKTTDVLVGHDARTHSPSLTKAFIDGAVAQGAKVTFIGIVSTPLIIAMRAWKKHHTAVIITASHLTAEFNGLKLYGEGGWPLNTNKGLAEVEALVKKNDFSFTHHGSVVQTSYTQEYCKRICDLHPLHSTLHFVADCSSGAAGLEVALIKKQLHLNIDILNEEPDGRFPNHPPNPVLPQAQEQIKKTILNKKAAGGCIFDPDADRIVFIDEKGNYIHPNVIGCIIIEQILKKHPGATIAYDLISSQVVPKTISKLGGRPLRTRVGRNVLIDDMRAQKAVFAAEVSSHMVFTDVQYADATTLSMLLVFDVLAQAKTPFSQLAEKYKLPPSQEANFRVDTQAALRGLEKIFPQAKKDHLDGLALFFDENTWLVARPSNTEPVLRVRGEGMSAQIIRDIFNQAQAFIESIGGHKEY